jgi:hypothetical protein
MQDEIVKAYEVIKEGGIILHPQIPFGERL